MITKRSTAVGCLALLPTMLSAPITEALDLVRNSQPVATVVTGHSWGNYVSKDLFGQHPDYLPMHDGSRHASDWYCTSNPGLRKVFARGVIERIEAGSQNPSISPPDGRGYCQCDACREQDDPNSREPSTGTAGSIASAIPVALPAVSP